jgi:hypothetical protein
MKIERAMVVLAVAAAYPLAGCQVYVDEPAKHPAAPPPPPAAQQAAPAAPKEVKVAPMHLHGAGVTPAAPPAGGGAAPVAACLDTGGTTVGDCAAMQPATACPAAPTPQQRCNAYKTYFAPKVAAVAVSCLTALTSAQVCDATQVAACGRAALAQACPAPGVSQLCQIAAGPCKTSATDCTAIISGLDDQGQQAIAQCVAQGCGAGLSACIDGMTSASTAVSSKH